METMNPCVWLLLLFSAVLSSSEQLQFVSVVFRHGARSPVTAYPNDVYQEDYWPQGFGQLSIMGMREEYHLGTLFKARYLETGFMNTSYDRSQIHVRSTNFDRTLMSAECVLAGMYPPNESEEFKPDLEWQPIPVHTVPIKDDILLSMASCPVYEGLLDEDNNAYKQVQKANQELFDNLTEWTGETVDSSNVGLLKDTLFVEYHDNNLTMPYWFTPQLLQKLESIDEFFLGLMFNTKQKRKLSGGVWANQVLKDIEDKVNGNIEAMKLVLYSAHDSTVATMQSVFDVFNGQQPPYSSAFVLELYSNGSNVSDYFVRFYYRNETDGDQFIILTHPNCTTDCPLTELLQIMSPYRLTEKEWSSICETASPSPSSSPHKLENWLIIALCVTSVILIIFVILLIASIVRKFCCRRQRKMYVSLNDQDNETK